MLIVCHLHVERLMFLSIKLSCWSEEEMFVLPVWSYSLAGNPDQCCYMEHPAEMEELKPL